MARTQAFDWFSTFLLAALILLVPILFVVWVNPGLLDRLQEEFAGRPAPVGRPDAPVVPADPDVDATPDDEESPERALPSKDDYISAPRVADGSPVSAESEAASDAARTAAKPVAIEETDPDAESSGALDADPASDDADGAVEPGVDPAPGLASDPIAPVEKSPAAAPLSTAPESLAVPPPIGPTAPADVDGDGDGGGLRPLDGSPATGSPTPATPPLAPLSGQDTEPEAAPAAGAMPDPAAADPRPALSPTLSEEERHEEILREIRSLSTAQRSLEDQFSALRQDIDGRLSVLKSAVDGVATNGSNAPGSAAPGSATLGNEALAGSLAVDASPAEQARAERAAKILRATLDGKLTLELGDESGTTIDFVYVPPGRFRMGRTAAESQAALANSVAAPAQEIVVDRGFFVSRHEVTDEQFVAFLRANYADDPKVDSAIKARDDLDRPAASVSWALAKFFCLWVAEESKFDVRLPTEIEWEYAARGPYSVLRPDSLSADAGTDEPAPSTGQEARDVGADPADRSWCGAEDLLGNVAEWCADVYDASAYAVEGVASAKVYSPAPAPADWVAVEAAGRSVRGGSFADPVETRDFSERRQAKPGVMSPTLGFRLVLIPDFDGESEVGQTP